MRRRSPCFHWRTVFTVHAQFRVRPVPQMRDLVENRGEGKDVLLPGVERVGLSIYMAHDKYEGYWGSFTNYYCSLSLMRHWNPKVAEING